jgi:ABC-type lipoprotein release transport system permease subunit
MGPAWAWARTELRRRRGAALALVLLIGLSGAVVLTAAAGARRTQTAFARFLESSHAADVQIQYQPSDGTSHDAVLAALRASPDVELAVPFYITVGFSADSDYDVGIYASPDPALFRDIDRPRIVDGRAPDPAAADELLVNPFTREKLGLQVGDTVRIGTFSAEQFGGDGPDGPPAGPVLEMRVVGVGVTPYDVADGTFVGGFATPAYFAAHWGQVGGYGPTLDVATRDGTNPTAVVKKALSGLALDEVFLSPSSEVEATVEDSTRVLAVGLVIFAAVAGLSMLVTSAQALRRRVSDAAPDQGTLRAIGLRPIERAAAAAMIVTPIAALGTVLAVVLAVPASVRMPLGTARRAEPHPGVDVDLGVLGIGGLVILLILLGVTATGALRLGRHVDGAQVDAGRGSRTAPGRFLRARLRPSAHLGVTMALDPGSGPTAVPVRSALVGAVVGATGVLAVLSFGAGLDTLVREPARSGWNWTFAPDGDEGDLPVLEHVNGVRDVGLLLHRQVVVDGEQMLGVAVQAEMGTPSLTVQRGRMPAEADEIAVAPKVAERSHVGVGDTIAVQDAKGRARTMRVVGEVLLPRFDDNPFNDGVAVAPEVIDELAVSDGFTQAIVTFDDHLAQAEAARRVRAVLPDALSVYSFPSLPPDVANLDQVRFLPRVLGAFLGLLAVAAVGHALATCVRRRRRDLGVARSLGFRRRDVAGALVAQSATLTLMGTALGIPVGLALGRVAWRVVASGIGVTSPAVTPVLAVAAVVGGAAALSVLLALLPGRAAARLAPVEVLRTE